MRLMTIKERLELDTAIEMKRVQLVSLFGDDERGARETIPSALYSIRWKWKRDNPDVTMIYQWRGTPKDSTDPEDYYCPGQGAAQQSLFKQVIQFDLPDNEQLKKAA